MSALIVPPSPIHELGLLPPELHPNVDHLVTEDDTPVDNLYTDKERRILTETLYTSRPMGERLFLAAADMGLYFSVRKPPLVPDVLLSADVETPQDPWPKKHRSYFIWEYGKPPDVVFEVVSNREGGEGDVKLLRYAQIGVPYYVIWDPEQHLGGDRLRVYGNRNGHNELLPQAWFPKLNLGLCVWHGVYEDMEADWLRWCDVQGKVIPTGAEFAAAAQQHASAANEQATNAKRQATAAKKQATAAKEQATAAEGQAAAAQQQTASAQQRADRLAVQLRALGVDPDQ